MCPPCYRPHPNGIPCSLLGTEGNDPGAFNCIFLSVVMEEKFSVRSVYLVTPSARVPIGSETLFSPPTLNYNILPYKNTFQSGCLLSLPLAVLRRRALARRLRDDPVVWQPCNSIFVIVPVMIELAPHAHQDPPGYRFFRRTPTRERTMNAPCNKTSPLTPEQRSFSRSALFKDDALTAFARSRGAARCVRCILFASDITPTSSGGRPRAER